MLQYLQMTSTRMSPNHREIISFLDSGTGRQVYPTATNGKIDVNASVTATITASTSAFLYTGQTIVNTTQVQVTAGGNTLTNGIIIKSLSTNTANIYVGLTGVTASTGDVLEPGEARGYAVNNTNLLYIISTASLTDKVSWSAN